MKKEKRVEFPTTDLDDDHKITLEYTTDYLSNAQEYTLSKIDDTDSPVSVVEYRGFTVPIYMDDPGQQYYCILDGQEIGFGTYNFNYASDLEYLIDSKLDTIHRFSTPYYGAVLSWFENSTNRDIKLEYKQRILKVWLVADESKVDTDKLIKESESILAKLITTDEI